mmetsp:Transcript_105060/g.181182  ORF Transcript_105060/g.181182 Transcript_105060/m.181182 type:complete len:133 (+) Transcript_105060:179-577(+)
MHMRKYAHTKILPQQTHMHRRGTNGGMTIGQQAQRTHAGTPTDKYASSGRMNASSIRDCIPNAAMHHHALCMHHSNQQAFRGISLPLDKSVPCTITGAESQQATNNQHATGGQGWDGERSDRFGFSVVQLER